MLNNNFRKERLGDSSVEFEMKKILHDWMSGLRILSPNTENSQIRNSPEKSAGNRMDAVRERLEEPSP